jgi:hypothetical protein
VRPLSAKTLGVLAVLGLVVAFSSSPHLVTSSLAVTAGASPIAGALDTTTSSSAARARASS